MSIVKWHNLDSLKNTNFGESLLGYPPFASFFPWSFIVSSRYWHSIGCSLRRSCHFLHLDLSLIVCAARTSRRLRSCGVSFCSASFFYWCSACEFCTAWRFWVLSADKFSRKVLLNLTGSRKLSKLNSSSKLFWRGVPDKRILKWVYREMHFLKNFELLFFTF